MVPWKSIGVALKSGQSDMAPLLERVVGFIRERGLDVVFEFEAAAQVAGSEGLSLEDTAGRVDLFIVLGGDGTVLATARAIGTRAVPILGINLGHLGFLTDVAPADVDSALISVFNGDYVVQERARIEVVTWEGEREVSCELALNDAVFSKGPDIARLIDLEVYVDGKRLGNYRADGLVVSTPTGSTAYSLSAGGPILDPSVAAIILTPICPHTLSLRPVVLADDSTVEVRLPRDEHVYLTLDGQVGRPLRPAEFVRITRSAHPVRFLSTPDRDHFGTVRAKLGWGTR
jgi:NAD+ kinase